MAELAQHLGVVGVGQDFEGLEGALAVGPGKRVEHFDEPGGLKFDSGVRVQAGIDGEGDQGAGGVAADSGVGVAKGELEVRGDFIFLGGIADEAGGDGALFIVGRIAQYLRNCRQVFGGDVGKLELNFAGQRIGHERVAVGEVFGGGTAADGF